MRKVYVGFAIVLYPLLFRLLVEAGIIKLRPRTDIFRRSSNIGRRIEKS
jgi:hypothetical protein